MTRDEAIATAIATLESIKQFGIGKWMFDKEENEAFDIAIEALSAEQKEEDLANDIARRMATIIENEEDMRVILKNASAESTDLISRADVLALAEKGYIISNSNYKKVCDLINELPSADRPSGEWIHCSERMPEDGQGVIICTDDKRFKDHPVGTCTYEHGRFHTNFYYDISIIAWMPLPKPYCPPCGANMGGERNE